MGKEEGIGVVAGSTVISFVPLIHAKALIHTKALIHAELQIRTAVVAVGAGGEGGEVILLLGKVHHLLPVQGRGQGRGQEGEVGPGLFHPSLEGPKGRGVAVGAVLGEEGTGEGGERWGKAAVFQCPSLLLSLSLLEHLGLREGTRHGRRGHRQGIGGHCEGSIWDCERSIGGHCERSIWGGKGTIWDCEGTVS